MKPTIIYCILLLFSLPAFSQEFRIYLNGSNVKDSSFESFKDGDLLRVVFSGKTTSYNFRIATLQVTLTPVKNIGADFAGRTTSFILDNTSTGYTSTPSFTVDLYERLTLLKYNEYEISVSVKQLFADSPEGQNWILENVRFEDIPIRRRLSDNSK